jgi:hypothetical protein
MNRSRAAVRLFLLVSPFAALACGGGGSATSPGGGSGGGGVTSFSGYRGVFALEQNGVPIDPAVFANPNIDGVALRVRWSDVEPSEGAFNFSFLDGQLAAAGAAGKTASISVVAGIDTPSWVYAAGAASFSTVVAEKFDANFCQPIQVPVPWDSVFLQKWTALIQSLGARYQNNPVIGKMHITGINNHNEETSLPSEEGETIQGLHGSPCQTNNDIQEWMSIGYTSALVKNAWVQIADAFSSGFPKVKIAPMVHPGGFPPINDAGQTDPNGAQLQDSFIPMGIAKYGQQFAVQNNGLSQGFADPSEVAVSGSTTTGYQMLYDVTNDGTCRMNHSSTPCDPRTDLQGAINNGIQSGGTYLEIYEVDILNSSLADIIASAHTQLAH